MSGTHAKGEAAENEGVARAMQEVLQAEDVAARRISESRSAVAATVQAARAKAESIRRRADARIARLHARDRERIEAEMADSQQLAPAGPANWSERSAYIDDAVTRLAVALTS